MKDKGIEGEGKGRRRKAGNGGGKGLGSQGIGPLGMEETVDKGVAPQEKTGEGNVLQQRSPQEGFYGGFRIGDSVEARGVGRRREDGLTRDFGNLDDEQRRVGVCLTERGKVVGFNHGDSEGKFVTVEMTKTTQCGEAEGFEESKNRQ